MNENDGESITSAIMRERLVNAIEDKDGCLTFSDVGEMCSAISKFCLFFSFCKFCSHVP